MDIENLKIKWEVVKTKEGTIYKFKWLIKDKKDLTKCEYSWLEHQFRIIKNTSNEREFFQIQRKDIDLILKQPWFINKVLWFWKYNKYEDWIGSYFTYKSKKDAEYQIWIVSIFQHKQYETSWLNWVFALNWNVEEPDYRTVIKWFPMKWYLSFNWKIFEFDEKIVISYKYPNLIKQYKEIINQNKEYDLKSLEKFLNSKQMKPLYDYFNNKHLELKTTEIL